MRLVSLFAAGLLAAPAIAQFQAVAPNGYAATQGNTNNAYPWNQATTSTRVQFIYDSTNFTLQGITSPILINNLRYRPATTTASWGGGSWPNVQIDLATCTSDYLAPSTTYAANMGPDLTTVHTGAVVVQPGTGSGPTNWHIDIPLTTPFVYDPNGGDLVVDIQLDGTGWSGSSTQADHVSATAVSPPLGTRIYNTTSATAATGTIGTNYAAVCEFGYVPAAGLYPSFSATPLSGPIGQTVQFTDNSYSSAPGGVLAWQWDFNGDSVIDSALQNPTFQYTAGGFYNVSLTVIDSVNPPQTLTRTNYIAIGAVDASFTMNAIGLVAQFTDTSTNNPTSWQWDFEDDGIVDSNLPNPVHLYPAAGSYRCKLTVANAFSTDSTIVNVGLGIIPLPAFGSTYTAQQTRGYWFQAPVRFSIVSAQVPDESAHGLQNVAIYRMASAPPAYAASATGGLEFFSTGQPSNVSLPCAVSFDAGEFVGVLGACGDSTTMRNSYATPVGPFASSVLGVPTTLTRFLAQANLVVGAGLTPYSSEAAGALARVTLGVSAAVGLQYGAGSPSPYAPAPTLRTTALPVLGQNAQLTLTTNDAQSIGILAVGLGRASLPTPFGTLLLNGIVGTDLFNGGAVLTPGDYTYSFAVPSSPALQGFGPVNWQAALLVLPNGEFALSNATEWWLSQ
jgi:PKD repeat protein